MSELNICCPVCGGDGWKDSGGQNPDGSWINIECPECKGRGFLTPQEYKDAIKYLKVGTY